MINQTEMDRKLYKSMWISQCKEIDTDILSFEDTLLVQKCIHQQEITDDELEQLRLILTTYNKINKEFNVSEMEDNITNFKEEIKSEQEFLQLIEETSKPQRLQKEYNVAGKTVKLNFIVYPVVNSVSVYDIIDHADVFAQLTDDEQKIYQKASTGKLTPKEQEMLDKLNGKVQRMLMTSDNVQYLVDSFLARQVELEESTLTTLDEKMEFWGKVDDNLKLDLFNTVKQMLNISGGSDLFQ